MEQLGYVFIVGIVVIAAAWSVMAIRDRKNNKHHHA